MDLVTKGRFPVLDEVCILGNQTAVKYQQNSISGGHVLDQPQVFHGERLTADQVGCGFHADVGNFFRAIFLNGIFKLTQIHVPFKRDLTVGNQGIIGEDFQHLAAGQVNMRLGGGEVIVHQHHIARFDKCFRQQMFRCPCPDGPAWCNQTRRLP